MVKIKQNNQTVNSVVLHKIEIIRIFSERNVGQFSVFTDTADTKTVYNTL